MAYNKKYDFSKETIRKKWYDGEFQAVFSKGSTKYKFSLSVVTTGIKS